MTNYISWETVMHILATAYIGSAVLLVATSFIGLAVLESFETSSNHRPLSKWFS